MRRVRFAVWLALMAVAASPAAQQQEPTFKSGTHTVPVYATVLDASGRLVPDLKQDDFQILDNGAPQPITVFSNAIRPITVVVMLDRSGSMTSNFQLERQAAVQFVATLLPADKARLGSFSNRIEIDPTEFTSDQDALIRILYEDLQDAGPTPLWGATSAAMSALSHTSDNRRVVLVFTDGYDNPPNPMTGVKFNEVRDRAEAAGIMVYAIGLADTCGLGEPLSAPAPFWPLFQGRGGFGRRGRGGFGSSGRGACSSEGPDPHLRELAATSGGGYFELKGTDDLTATFVRVADELHHQYLIGFVAPALDGKVHTLELKVRPPGLTARARQSYVAPSGV